MMRVLSIILVVLLSACGNAPSGVGTTTTSTTTASTTTTTTTTTTGATVTGSVGDGPVSGATLTFTDSSGSILTVTDNNANSSGSTAKSTATAAYSVTLPSSAVFPVTVTSTGGTDLSRSQLGLATTAPTMGMASVIMDVYSTVTHISPLTTLVVEAAKIISGSATFTAAQLTTAKQQAVAALGLGLDSLSADFLTTATASISTADMATILQANEAIGAIVARTQAATTGSTEGSVVASLAKDVSDGVMDGLQGATALGTQEATNLVQVHAKVQQDLYTSHVVKLDATDIAGTTAVASMDGSGLLTLGTTIGVTLKATDPYAADSKLKTSSSAATNSVPATIVMKSGTNTGKTADGSGSYTVTVQVLNSNAATLLGQVVALSWTTANNGIVTITQMATPLVTDSNGQVSITVSDLNGSDDTVKISATVGALTTPTGSEISLSFTGTGSGATSGTTTTTTGSTASISIVPAQATIGTVVSNGIVLNPQHGSPFDLYTTATAIDSYGTWASGTNTVQLRFYVRDGSGVALSGKSVNFSASGSQGGSPQISPAGMNTLTDGYATVTVTNTVAETVTVTAKVDAVTTTQAVIFFAMDPASIRLKSVTPTTAVIGISGSSSSTTAGTMTFEVLDVNNNVVQGSHQVDFSIVGGGLNGGESLNSNAASTLNGVASTVLTAGSKAGLVTVHAQLNATPSIATDATITITGGLPTGDSLILASSPLNIAGRMILGLTQSVTTFVSDFFGNPVATGVGVQYQRDYANITGSAIFSSGGSGSQATATVTSAAPQPVDGLVTISAQTTGGVHSKVLSIAVDHKNSNNIYLGTDGGGVFHTIDGGATWEHKGVPFKGAGANLFANLTGTIIRDLKIDPNNSATVYAATDKGLFVSIDDGKSWNSKTGLRRISGDILGTAAGTALTSKGRGETFNFNFSHDGVRSRTTVSVNGTPTTNYQLQSSSILMLKALTAGDKVTADYDVISGIFSNFPIYAVSVDAGTYDAAYSYVGTMYVGTLGDGVWKTVTAGNSWNKVSGMKSAGQSFNLRVLSLTVDAYNSGLLFAGTDGGGLFVSDNYAGSWSKVGGTSAFPLSESTVQTIVARDPYVWIGGKNGVHFSDSYASNWYGPTAGTNATDRNNLDVRALAVDPNDGTIYAATFGDVLKKQDPYGGVYVSNDYYSWSKATDVGTVAGAHSMDALDIYAQTGADIVVAGSEGRLLSVSNDSGTSWVSKPGTSPANLNNTLFATAGVMHSGNTVLKVIPQTMTYQPQNDGTTGGFGSSGTIYNGETHAFYVRVADDLGNPLVGGSTLSVTATSGKVGGTSATTITDSVHGSGDYTVSWINDLATVSATDVTGSLTVSVTSTNGNDSLTLTKTLVNPVNGTAPAVIDTYSNPSNTNTAVTVTASGGSNGKGGYKFVAGLGCATDTVPCTGTKSFTSGAGVTSHTFYYKKATAAGTVTDTVTITDLVTKKSSAPVTVTITYQ